MLKLDSLQKLLVHELKDLYSAEHQYLKAIPRMADAANDKMLSDALNLHLKQMRMHIDRLNEGFTTLGFQPGGHRCMAMEELIRAARDFSSSEAEAEVADAALIASAQRIGHYELAGYGTALALAHKLGFHELAVLLKRTLNEDLAMEQKLSQLADCNMILATSSL